MATTIGINGFGRIGRSVARIALDDADVELVGINDLCDLDQLAHLFKRDSVHGTYHGDVEVTGDGLRIDDSEIKVTSISDPSELPWDDLGVDIAIESTGVFRKREDAAKHLEAGADNVVISAPGKGTEFSLCFGVNEDQYDPSLDIIDTASCTTNCLAPVAKVLHDNFGIEKGLMTTIHAYTNSQNILDGPHKKDFRRARAAAVNQIPTTTGAANAVTEVLPELEGKLDGMAIRVPTPNVSCIDFVVSLEKSVDVDTVNEAFESAANGPMEGVLGYTDEPLVSSDFVGNPHSSIVDADATMGLDDGFIKVISWYDNEWGFSNRLVDAVKLVSEKS